MRRLLRRVFSLLMLATLCVGGWSCQWLGSGASHKDTFDDNGLLDHSASALRATIVTPVTDVAIPEKTNVLWCGSFQMAWNEVTKLTGGEVRFAEESPAIASLNRRTFDSASLDDESYVALAGYVKDGVVAKIPAALSEKFHGKQRPELLPDPNHPGRPNDIVAYSYLFKDLQFPVHYERGDSPMPIDGEKIACFGMGTDASKTGREEMAKQTSILDYVGPDDFIVELKSISPADRLILAKVQSSKTLAGTITEVQARVDRASPAAAQPWDVLVVPKINFRIKKSFDGLQGRSLRPTAPGMPNDALLLQALQVTRFQIDEAGVRLKSESAMSFGCSTPARHQPAHVMVFDKPFLLMLERTGAKTPYFALWVGNTELLTRAD